MKIGIFAPCFYPPRIEGIKNNVYSLCSQLNDKVDLKIITHKSEYNIGANNNKDTFKVYYLLPISKNILKQIYYYFYGAFKSLKFCYNNKFDIINFHYLETSFILPIIFLSFLRKKIVLTIYSFDEITIRYKKLILKALKNKIGKIIIISESLRSHIISLGFTNKKIEYIPISFDKKRYLKMIDFKDRNPNNVLFSAGINKSCGSFFMVDLAKELPGFNFYFTLRKFNSKSEHDLKILMEYIINNQVKNITILRNIDNMEIVLSKIGSLIIPLQSINAKMAVPVALIEAMARGTVCFVSDLKHLQTIINNKNAVIFKKNNIKDLKEKLVKIDSYYKDGIGNNAYNFAKSYPDSIRIGNTYLHVFKNI